jgi:malonate-semialdehyde dehydrogenase (acetylating)/methylmalonate-semialdehyde dehydrogenase
MNKVELVTDQEVLNFIGGQWIKGSGDKIDITSPYYGKIIGHTYASNKNDVKKAVEAAKQAQPQWGKLSHKARAQVLFNFRNILIRDIEKISQVISLENGKTLAESRAGIMKGVEVLEYALSLQNADSQAKMEVSSGVFCEYRRRPLGIVASITPFNFPAMVPMWTIPIAIALGNAYIWKPSEKTPLTAKYIVGAFSEAGLPDGILSVIQGASEAVNAIIDHQDVEAISFVGSTKVAEIVYKRATHLGKRCLALGGAKNHIILLPDADPEISGVGISDSFTGCAGQRCMAASVLLAVGDCDHIIKEIQKRAESQTLGDSMGAIITREQMEFLNDEIEKAVKDGATLLVDGRKMKATSEYAEGFWLGPTILDNISPGSRPASFELFGPILSIVRVNNVSEAVEIQNSNQYGNASSVFTTSGPMAEKIVNQVTAGMVGINIGVPVPREPFSFGGVKASKFGHGDITGENSLNFWSHVIKVTTKWEMQKDHNWMS